MTSMPLAVVLFATFLVVYTLILYPLLLVLLRRFRWRPIARAPITPTVSVIIAVHNGAVFLPDKIRSIMNLEYPAELLQVIVASDGSTDTTVELASQFDVVSVLNLPRGGKCAALNAAISCATGEILLLTDVRQTLEPDSLRLLVRNFADPCVGAVSGLLKIRAGPDAESRETGAYWRYESLIRDCLSSIDSIFGASGAFYALRRSLAVPIPPDILLDDMYLPLAAFRRGYRLIFDTDAIFWDFPTNRATEFRRKVRTLAGNFQLWAYCPWLLTPANRLLWHFLSYKVARLFLPWLLAAIFIASWLLPAPWKWLYLAPQIIAYSLAALHSHLPSALQRISSPLRTFCVMMIATVFALRILFTPARDLWLVPGPSSFPPGG